MLGLRGAGVIGATVIIAGGVAYLVWKYAEKKPQSRPEKSAREEEEVKRKEGKKLQEEGERKEERVAVVGAAPPGIEVTPAPKASEVKLQPTHLPLHLRTVEEEECRMPKKSIDERALNQNQLN